MFLRINFSLYTPHFDAHFNMKKILEIFLVEVVLLMWSTFIKFYEINGCFEKFENMLEKFEFIKFVIY